MKIGDRVRIKPEAVGAWLEYQRDQRVMHFPESLTEEGELRAFLSTGEAQWSIPISEGCHLWVGRCPVEFLEVVTEPPSAQILRAAATAAEEFFSVFFPDVAVAVSAENALFGHMLNCFVVIEGREGYGCLQVGFDIETLGYKSPAEITATIWQYLIYALGSGRCPFAAERIIEAQKAGRL